MIGQIERNRTLQTVYFCVFCIAYAGFSCACAFKWYAAGYFTYMVSLAISAALYGWVSEGEDAEERRARRKRVAQIHFTAGGGKSIFDIYEEITGGQVLSAEEMTNALMKHGFK